MKRSGGEEGKGGEACGGKAASGWRALVGAVVGAASSVNVIARM